MRSSDGNDATCGCFVVLETNHTSVVNDEVQRGTFRGTTSGQWSGRTAIAGTTQGPSKQCNFSAAVLAVAYEKSRCSDLEPLQRKSHSFSRTCSCSLFLKQLTK